MLQNAFVLLPQLVFSCGFLLEIVNYETCHNRKYLQFRNMDVAL